MRAFATLLGLLGFASCKYIGFGIDMYGQPYADFKAVGDVSDEAGNPVMGIRVAIRQHRHDANTGAVIYDRNDWYDNDTVFTDNRGTFHLSRDVFSEPQEVTLVFEDVDGDANGGLFETQKATPAVVRVKKGDGSWYGGAFQVESHVTLKKAD